MTVVEDERELRRRLEAMAAEGAEAAAYLQDLARAMFPAGSPGNEQLTWADRRNGPAAAHDRRTDAETRLRAAEARFRALVEQIPAVTFMAVLGEGQNEVYVSPHIQTLLGFSQKEWLDNPFLWYSQLHPDDRELWNLEFARGCRQGGPFRAECRFLAREGHVVWVHGEARVIRDELGRPAYLQGIAFDITEAKRAQELVLNEAVKTARYEEELALAQRVQTSILPRRLEVPGLEIAAVMLPASEVGGDYYEVLPAADGCWLGIGDVAGHGLSAGLVMMMVQSATAAIVAATPTATPAEVLVRLNRVLYENIRERLGQDHHVTFTMLRYRIDGRLTFAGAHEEMLVHRARTGLVETVPTPGTWLGARREIAPFTVDHELRLEPGDVLLLYTDGVTEAMDGAGKQYGLDRLAEVLARHHEAPVATIRDAILGEVKGWMVQQADDISILVVRQKGA